MTPLRTATLVENATREIGHSFRNSCERRTPAGLDGSERNTEFRGQFLVSRASERHQKHLLIGISKSKHWFAKSEKNVAQRPRHCFRRLTSHRVKYPSMFRKLRNHRENDGTLGKFSGN